MENQRFTTFSPLNRYGMLNQLFFIGFHRFTGSKPVGNDFPTLRADLVTKDHERIGED
jgi:hypothetical protein